MTKHQAILIQAEIRRLMRKAETGEQWAEICLLEDKLVKAGYAA